MKYVDKIFDGIIKKLFSWLPDSLYLRLLYLIKMHEPLNLSNPQKFTEKIQWLKLHSRKPEFTAMVDKYAIKKYVCDLIGKEYVVPMIGIWDSFDEIDFNALPVKFVLKTTHGGGSCGVVICHDKSTFDKERAKRKLNNSLHTDIYQLFREWPYKDVPRRIMAEELIEIPESNDLTDYKLFCFNGDPKYIQVIKDRNTHETIDFFDADWNHQPFYGLNPKVKNSSQAISKPAGLADMIKIARRLAKDIPFVRVDFYQVGNRVYFGEITFFPNSGFGRFTPPDWNRKLGDMIKLQI